VTYPEEALHRELAYVAYYLHWPRDLLLGLEHAERRRWVAEVSHINTQLSDEPEGRPLV
jgi:hypothetical protein